MVPWVPFPIIPLSFHPLRHTWENLPNSKLSSCSTERGGLSGPAWCMCDLMRYLQAPDKDCYGLDGLHLPKVHCWKPGLQCSDAETTEPLKSGVWGKVIWFRGSTFTDALILLLQCGQVSQEWTQESSCYKARLNLMFGLCLAAHLSASLSGHYAAKGAITRTLAPCSLNLSATRVMSQISLFTYKVPSFWCFVIATQIRLAQKYRLALTPLYFFLCRVLAQ